MTTALTDDDMRALRTVADMQGLAAEFAELERRAALEPVNDPRCVAHVSVYEDGGITALYMPEHGAQMLALLQEDARLHKPAALCACKDRPATACPGEWEPGCDLGANPAHVRAAG